MRRICALVLCLLLAAAAALPAVAAAEEPSAVLDDEIRYDSGRTVITWSVTGSFDSFNLLMQAVNGYAEQSLWRLGNVSRKSFTTSELMPGKTYAIILADQDFTLLDQKVYTIPEAETFVDGGLKDTSVKISVEPRKLPANEEKPKKIDNFSAAAIMDDLLSGSASYGIKYYMKMPTLIKDRVFFVTIYFEAPDGYLECILADDIQFTRVNEGYQELWFDFLGSFFFQDMYNAGQEIPQGDYTVWTFWNGMYVNATTFRVSP